MIKFVLRITREVLEFILLFNLILWTLSGYYFQEGYYSFLNTFSINISDSFVIPIIIGFLLGVVTNVIFFGLFCVLLEIHKNLSEINSKLTEMKRDNSNNENNVT